MLSCRNVRKDVGTFKAVGVGPAARTPTLQAVPELLNNPCGFRPILQNILDYVTVQDMKNLRLISKSWDFSLRPNLSSASVFLIDLDVPLTRTSPENQMFRRVFLHFNLDEFRRKSRLQVERLEATFPSKSLMEPTLRIRHLYLTLSVLIKYTAVDDLVAWLEVYGAWVKSLRIDKQDNVAFRRTIIGTCPSLLNEEAIHRILRTMPQVQTIRINSFRLLSTREQVERLLVIPPFPVPFGGRNNLDDPQGIDYSYASVKSLKIHDVYPSHKNANFIRSFTKLEKLTLSFSAYAKPGLKLEALGIQTTLENLVELELFCESGGVTQFGVIALEHLSRIQFRRLEKLKVDRVRFIDGDNMDEDLSLGCLLALLDRVKKTLSTLDVCVQCSRVCWERLCSSMPQMDKLKTLSFKMFGESSRDPLIQMLPKVPAVERLNVSYVCYPRLYDRRNLKALRLITHQQVPYGESVKELKIDKIESPITRPTLTQLLLCFYRINTLDIPVWCTKTFSLRMHWDAINRLAELRNLKLRMMGIAQKDFTDSIAHCKDTELSSLSFVISKEPRIKLKLGYIRKSFENIPNLKLLEFMGFERMKEEDKTNIEQLFAHKSPFLCVKIL